MTTNKKKKPVMRSVAEIEKKLAQFQKAKDTGKLTTGLIILNEEVIRTLKWVLNRG